MKSEIKRRAIQGDPYSQVEVWNARYPVGTPVDVTQDDGSVVVSKTRSEAWVLGHSSTSRGHTAVVMYEGRSGGYLLSRVKPSSSGDGDDA